ncbi:MAG: HDOD domain-containing protein [Spirochaetota bacterium]
MLNIEEINDKLVKGEEVLLQFSFVNDETNQEIYNLLVHILAYLDQLFLSEILSTILKELLMNAAKANAKRLFFERKKLNILDDKHYQRGMSGFLTEVTSKWDEQEQYTSQSQYYIELKIKMGREGTFFFVRNNAVILPEELERVKKRIESAKKYNDLSDAFLDLSDNQESAGLGIILIQVLLKNSGIGTEKFQINSDKDFTTASLEIPQNAVPKVMHSKFNEKILNETDSIPQLPQSVNKVIILCNNPETTIQALATEIERNPSLSAQLLKLANSTFFLTRNKVNNITNAIKIVGMKNIKNMLYVSGVRELMGSRYKRVEHVWEHSNKVSIVARQIAMNFGKGKYGELASIGGLLHDIGKLVLLSLDRSLIKKMDSFIEKEKLNSVLIEEVSLGISHAEIGAILAQKWAFPDELINIIKFHHRPFLVEEDDKEILDIVYLANKIVDIWEKEASYYTIDKRILEKFSFTNIEKFDKFIAKVKDKIF